MLQKDLISKFLESKTVAVFGVSRKGDIPANYIYRKFKQAGFETFAINPNTSEIEGDKCYPALDSIPKNRRPL